MVRPSHHRRYTWDANDQLKQITDQSTGTTIFEHDKWGNLSRTIFNNGEEQLRNPDMVGNLFETKDRRDRKYNKGGQLAESKTDFYTYDAEGFLTEKKCKNGGLWKYEWNAAGMLQKVTRPDETEVHFKYDALGRRIEKRYKKTVTKWVWDGNKPLHEWKEFDAKEGTGDLITWIVEEDSFAPTAKIKADKKYSILADHLGTPIQGYNEEGSLIWERQLDSFGRVKMLKGDEGFCENLYQGQIFDKDVNLCYNRFRYYDLETGSYISQDPIGLQSGEPNFYAYVHDPNSRVDELGLYGTPSLPKSRIASTNGVIIEHYYPDDHLPVHFHVYEEGKKNRATKIGENGTPLKKQRDLTPKEAEAVERHRKEIRKAGGKIKKWFGFKNHGEEYFKQKERERAKRKAGYKSK